MWERMRGTLEQLWSTSRGRAAVIVAGLLVVAVAAGIALVSLPGQKEPVDPGLEVPPVSSEPPASSDTEDLFELLPPSSPVQPPIAENGQTDIGGPGMVANGPEPVYGLGPMATPDAVTGLMPVPSKVPVEELIVPLTERLGDAQACASPRVPQSRAIANQMLAYLYTWDASKATWSDFIDPIEALWMETAEPKYPGFGPMKVVLGSSWPERLESFGFSEAQWNAWAAAGVRSQVEINQVVTLAGHEGGVRPYAVQVQYLVTVTREAPGIEPQERHELVSVDVYAPCLKATYPLSWQPSLMFLQAADFAVLEHVPGPDEQG